MATKSVLEVLCNSCRHDHEDGCEVPDSSVPYRCAISDPRNRVPLTSLNHRNGNSEPSCLGYIPTLNAPPHLRACYPIEEVRCDVLECNAWAVWRSENGFPYCKRHKRFVQEGK